MTLDEMALAVACALGVDSGCGHCEAYVIRRLASAFPAYKVEVNGGAGSWIVSDPATGERRLVDSGSGMDAPPPRECVAALTAATSP